MRLALCPVLGDSDQYDGEESGKGRMKRPQRPRCDVAERNDLMLQFLLPRGGTLLCVVLCLLNTPACYSRFFCDVE